MLVISKPTVFGSDGMAVRGQCNHDTADWRLDWVDPGVTSALIWQGDYKTCRRLQAGCRKSATLAEVRTMADALLSPPPSSAKTGDADKDSGTDLYETDHPPERERPPTEGHAKRKKKKKRHA